MLGIHISHYDYIVNLGSRSYPGELQKSQFQDPKNVEISELNTTHLSSETPRKEVGGCVKRL